MSNAVIDPHELLRSCIKDHKSKNGVLHCWVVNRILQAGIDIKQ